MTHRSPFSDDGHYIIAGLGAGDYTLRIVPDRNSGRRRLRADLVAGRIGQEQRHPRSGGPRGRDRHQSAIAADRVDLRVRDWPDGIPLAAGTMGQCTGVHFRTAKQPAMPNFRPTVGYTVNGLPAGDYRLRFEARAMDAAR